MMPGFVAVATTGDVPPGHMWCARLNGQRFLIANVEGVYYALGGTCSHEDVSLCTGALQGDSVKCPLHGSRFSIRSGAVIEGPAEEALPTYPVQVDGGRVWVKSP